MSYTSQQYAQALYECIKNAEKSKIKFYINNLYNILLKNNDIALFKDICNKTQEIDKQEKGIVDVIITSTHTLDNNTLKQIKQILSPDFQEEVGRRSGGIQIKQIIDPDLIGGIKIQIGDTIIDGSIKKQLNSLKQQMK